MAESTDGRKVIARNKKALHEYAILDRYEVGIGTTVPFLHFVMCHPDFSAGKVNTRLVEELIPQMALQVGDAE